jgi:hypothetical protein
VEFSHRGVTGLEHFDVQLTGDHAELLRADFSDEAIHQVAPGPETVVGIASHFRQSRHGALEGVGVQVGHARQQRTAQPFGAICGGIGLDWVSTPSALTSRRTWLAHPLGSSARSAKKADMVQHPIVCYLYIHIQTFACPVNSGKLATFIQMNKD